MSRLGLLGAAAFVAFAGAGCSPGRDLAEFARYLETDPDAGTRLTRMLATPAYLRIDDDRDDGDFVLFDRRARVVYSVAHNACRVTVVEDATLAVAAPGPLEIRVEGQDLPGAPPVGGQQPVLHRVFANDRLCAEAVSVKLLPAMVQALREFALVLATQQAALYRDVPGSIQGECDLVNYLLRPAATLEHGLPLTQRFAGGRARELRDHAEGVRVAGALFSVPGDYSVFRLASDPAPQASERN